MEKLVESAHWDVEEGLLFVESEKARFLKQQAVGNLLLMYGSIQSRNRFKSGTSSLGGSQVDYGTFASRSILLNFTQERASREFGRLLA